MVFCDTSTCYRGWQIESQHDTDNGRQRIGGQVRSEKEQASFDTFVYFEIGSNRLKAVNQVETVISTYLRS